MKYLIKSLVILSVVSAAVSCNKETNSHKPIDHDTTTPARVTDIHVSNRAGGAVVTYNVPDDPHLLYVKAVYTMTNGKQNEVKASYYNDSLRIVGFADTLEHEVKIFSVSRSGITSSAEIVKIKPYEATIWQVFRSIRVVNSFGGYDLTAVNDSGADIAIAVLKKNPLGEFEIDNDMSIYTSQDSILSKQRGLDTITYRFGFLVRDHWGNTTDTVYKEVNPLFETELDRSKFKEYALPGDALQTPNTRMEYAWDGKFGWPYTSFTWRDGMQPADVAGKPHMITFDLGVVAKLSRIWIRPYDEAGEKYYFFTTMKRFEIYGSVKPSSDGAMDDSWHLLGSYTVVKPSGLPYGVHNEEDVQTAEAGFNWSISLDAPKVEYIRIKCLENFGGGYQQSINELKVYGDPR